MCYGLSHVAGPAAWRAPIGIQLIFAITVSIVIFGCPESPRWLAKRGREREAIEVLCAFNDLLEDDPYIQDEIEAIRAAIAVETGAGAQKISALFRKDNLQTRRRVFLAWLGLFFNQMSGINLLIYYMPTVLVENVGMTPGRAQLVAGFVQIMFPIGNLLPCFALDRMGRRKTMLVGAGLLSCCMLMITILLSFGKPKTSEASITFFFLFNLFFGATLNVVPWVWGPEILPLEARARGTAISVSSHWVR